MAKAKACPHCRTPLGGSDQLLHAIYDKIELPRPAAIVNTQLSAILARLRQSRIVCSDETAARVKGWNAGEWVFQNDTVCVHVIRNSRARAVAEAVMDGHKPAIWVSDLYAGQRGLRQAWQICLAHRLRDGQYAIDAGDAIFPPGMKTLLLRACVLHGGGSG